MELWNVLQQTVFVPAIPLYLLSAWTINSLLLDLVYVYLGILSHWSFFLLYFFRTYECSILSFSGVFTSFSETTRRATTITGLVTEVDHTKPLSILVQKNAIETLSLYICGNKWKREYEVRKWQSNKTTAIHIVIDMDMWRQVFWWDELVFIKVHKKDSRQS